MFWVLFGNFSRLVCLGVRSPWPLIASNFRWTLEQSAQVESMHLEKDLGKFLVFVTFFFVLSLLFTVFVL